jgi:hypothetical protein
MSNITTEDNSTLEFNTTDSYTGEGLDNVVIVIYNKICGDSSSINLNENEARCLRDLLNEWLEE